MIEKLKESYNEEHGGTEYHNDDMGVKINEIIDFINNKSKN